MTSYREMQAALEKIALRADILTDDGKPVSSAEVLNLGQIAYKAWIDSQSGFWSYLFTLLRGGKP